MLPLTAFSPWAGHLNRNCASRFGNRLTEHMGSGPGPICPSPRWDRPQGNRSSRTIALFRSRTIPSGAANRRRRRLHIGRPGVGHIGSPNLERCGPVPAMSSLTCNGSQRPAMAQDRLVDVLLRSPKFGSLRQSFLLTIPSSRPCCRRRRSSKPRQKRARGCRTPRTR